VTLHLRTADGGDDRGGKSGAHREDGEATRASLGASLWGGTNPTLRHVLSGGPAERAGLAAGDVVVAIDGLRMSVDAIEALLWRRRPGETLAVHAFRRDELIVTSLTLAEPPRDVCWLSLDTKIGGDERTRRAAWLGPDG
jgi:predicted metalloprotease with PDZ domain